MPKTFVQGVLVWLGPAFLALVLWLPHFKQAPAAYDPSRLYWLPFQGNSESFLIQGYNGPFSHTNRDALDFVMPEGTYILAARRGQVYRVEDGSTETCPLTGDCPTNGVYILHDDGTTGLYVHMQLGGPCVVENQMVERGDVIGRSGNIGISALPHLHFEVNPRGTSPPTFVDVVGDGNPKPFRFHTSANTINVNHCE